MRWIIDSHYRDELHYLVYWDELLDFTLLRWTTRFRLLRQLDLHYWDELHDSDYWDELHYLDYWDELLDSHYWDELLYLD